MRWLLVTNVLLDVLADREPWVEHSAQVLELVERGRATGYVPAHPVTTLYYLLTTQRDRTTARRKTRLLLRLLEVVPVDEDRLLQALDLRTPDFEDALQIACAEKVGADVIVTRNGSDFRSTDLAVRSPARPRSRLPPPRSPAIGDGAGNARPDVETKRSIANQSGGGEVAWLLGESGGADRPKLFHCQPDGRDSSCQFGPKDGGHKRAIQVGRSPTNRRPDLKTDCSEQDGGQGPTTSRSGRSLEQWRAATQA